MPRHQYHQDGAKNSMWKGGLSRSTIERTTRKVLKEAGRDLNTCERCQFNTPFQELPRHHKDRDRGNNTVENLEVLCWGCHNAEHNKTRIRNVLGQFE